MERTLVAFIALCSALFPLGAEESEFDRLEHQTLALMGAGQWEEAGQMAQQAGALAEATYGKDDSRLVRPLLCLARSYFEQRQYDRAERAGQRALAIAERSPKASSTTTVMVLVYRGRLHRWHDEYGKAEEELRQAFDLLQAQPSPDDRWAIRVRLDLATALREIGKFHEPKALIGRALEVAERAFGPSSGQAAEALTALGLLEMAQRNPDLAEPSLRRALAIREAASSASSPSPPVANVLETLGGCCAQQNRLEEAEVLCRRALAIREESLGTAHVVTVRTICELGSICSMQGKHEEAEQLYRQGLVICEKSFPDSEPMADCLGRLGEALYTQRRYEEAASLFERGRTLCENQPSCTPMLPYFLRYLGGTYAWLPDRRGEAETPLRRAIQLYGNTEPPQPLEVARTKCVLARLYTTLHQDDRSLPLYEEAVPALEEGLGSGPWEVISAGQSLADLHHRAGRHREARELEKRFGVSPQTQQHRQQARIWTAVASGLLLLLGIGGYLARRRQRQPAFSLPVAS